MDEWLSAGVKLNEFTCKNLGSFIKERKQKEEDIYQHLSLPPPLRERDNY